MILPWARQVPSEHFEERCGEEVECVVIHHISLPPGEFGTGCVAALFTGTLDTTAHKFLVELEGLRVSAHFLIERDGVVTQFVDTAKAAWHAGESSWRGRRGVNLFSIGIELEGDEVSPYTEEQYRALRLLLNDLELAHPKLKGDYLTGHEEIAPGRKRDPGPLFEWGRFRNFS